MKKRKALSMSNNPKRKAYNFIIRNKLTNINFSALKRAAENIGYTIVEYNAILNDGDVKEIIDCLKLEELILRSRGFTYVDRNYRLIFINEDLNEDEKLLVLAHELGHIECEHFNMSSIIGNDVRQEYEANEFSHYLLVQNKLQKMISLIFCHKRKVLIVGLLLFITLLIFSLFHVIKKEKSYIGNYYITSTGNKYHKKDCIFVKERTTFQRLTKEEFENGNYQACDMCLPDK